MSMKLQTAVDRAKVALEDVRAHLDARLAKAAPRPTLAAQIARAVEAEIKGAFPTKPAADDGELHNMHKATPSDTASGDDLVRRALEAVEQATGEHDAAACAAILEQVLGEPVDLFDRDAGALELAKASTATPMPCVGGTGRAVEQARERLRIAEMQKANGVAVHPECLRALGADVDALEAMRTLQPTVIGRRPELDVGRLATTCSALGFRPIDEPPTLPA